MMTAIDMHCAIGAARRCRRRAGSCGSAPALAADPVPNKGDTAFMLIATVLVLLMTIPGLALFYGGLVRTKNMLSMLMQVFAIVCLVGDHLGRLRLQPGLHQRRRAQRLRRRLLARPS